MPSVAESLESGSDFRSLSLQGGRLGLEKSGPDSGNSATDGIRDTY